jgi:rhodanese-related sulfurtransferase
VSISDLEKSLFYNLNKVLERLEKLESKVEDLEKNMENSFALQRCHIMRVKNGDELSDHYILDGHQYADFSPEKAYRLYQQNDSDFILLDVSAHNHKPPKEIPETLHIPLEEIPARLNEIANKAVTLLVISEDGTRSIQACKLLNEKGYYNVNNISGGYKFWPALRLKEVPSNKKSA